MCAKVQEGETVAYIAVIHSGYHSNDPVEALLIKIDHMTCFRAYKDSICPCSRGSDLCEGQ